MSFALLVVVGVAVLVELARSCQEEEEDGSGQEALWFWRNLVMFVHVLLVGPLFSSLDPGVQDGCVAAPVSYVAASVLAQSLVASSCRDLVMFAVTVFVGLWLQETGVHCFGCRCYQLNNIKLIVGA